MLDKLDPSQSDSKTASGAGPDAILDTAPVAADDSLHSTITQFAKRLRLAGYNESAHFMEVAALIMEDQPRH